MSRTAKGALLVVLLLALALLAWPTVRGAAFVARAAGMGGPLAGALQRAVTVGVDERLLTIPWRDGELRARAYLPRAESEGAVLLVPGVHAAGIDEPRLDDVARNLAAMKRTVITMELPPLMRYRITPELTDMIEDAAGWLAAEPSLAGGTPIGLVGISFAGGLSIVAASRPSVHDRIAFVLSFGGHGDLPRTLEYLCTGIQPDGSHLPPHDYGVAIILLGVAGRVVPADQVEPLRAGILTFLEGSRLDMIDRDAAARAFAQARRMAGALPEPSASLLRAVNDRDVATLGPLLLPHVDDFGADPALSPARSPAPAAPVYLLHGAGDTVIPTMESALLAEDLRGRGARVRHLATPLITHAEVNNAAAVLDVWRLMRFWASVMGE